MTFLTPLAEVVVDGVVAAAVGASIGATRSAE